MFFRPAVPIPAQELQKRKAWGECGWKQAEQLAKEKEKKRQKQKEC